MILEFRAIRNYIFDRKLCAANSSAGYAENVIWQKDAEDKHTYDIWFDW